ncbi:MAG: type II and III secretion system protein [Verrucomicrobiales bacterium]|nr:type II and III secretion system protein [Verrucomicrobiales bacterium]
MKNNDNWRFKRNWLEALLLFLGVLAVCGRGVSEELDEFGLPAVKFEQLDKKSSALTYSEGLNATDDSEEAMVTKIYNLPMNFVSMWPRLDPDENGTEIRHKIHTVRGLLQYFGVVFESGAHAIYDAKTSRLIVRQTVPEMKKIDTYIATVTAQSRSERASINVRIEVYELKVKDVAKLLNAAESLADHSVQWQAVLLLLEKGEARLLSNVTLIARSGQSAKFSDVQEFNYAANSQHGKHQGEAGVTMFEIQEVGTIFEIKPKINASDGSVDLAFSFELLSAPPAMKKGVGLVSDKGKGIELEGPKFRFKGLVENISIADGSVRIIGSWLPSGKPEYENEKSMCIAFLKVDVQSIFPSDTNK